MGEYSKELCGGTHLSNTAEMGLFKIVGEESVAKGIRRISALTGMAALGRVQRDESLLRRVGGMLKVSVEELPTRVEALTTQVKTLQKQASAAPKSGGINADELLAGATDIGGVKIVVAEILGGTPQSIRELIDQFRRKAAPVATMFGTKQGDDKVMLIAALSRDLVDRGLSAVEWIKSSADLVGGGGGGRPDMAQAGGKIPGKLPEALAAGREDMVKRLS
jgi:alanyl-tRNA synthetase